MRRTIGLKDLAFLGGPVGGGGGDPCGSPPSLGTLKLWFRADVGVLAAGGGAAGDGDAVETWENQGGTQDAAQAVAGNRPTFHTNQINGKPILRFNASEHMLIPHGVDTIITGPEMMIFSVMKPNADDWNFLLTKNGINTSEVNYEIGVNTVPRWGFGGLPGQGIDSGATLITAGSFYKLYGRNDNGAVFTGARIYVNSTTQIGSTGSFKNGNNYVSSAYLGGRFDGLYGDQDIAEFGIYHGNISDADFTALDTYINCKYGL